MKQAVSVATVAALVALAAGTTMGGCSPKTDPPVPSAKGTPPTSPAQKTPAPVAKAAAAAKTPPLVVKNVDKQGDDFWLVTARDARTAPQVIDDLRRLLLNKSYTTKNFDDTRDERHRIVELSFDEERGVFSMTDENRWSVNMVPGWDLKKTTRERRVFRVGNLTLWLFESYDMDAKTTVQFVSSYLWTDTLRETNTEDGYTKTTIDKGRYTDRRLAKDKAQPYFLAPDRQVAIAFAAAMSRLGQIYRDKQ